MEGITMRYLVTMVDDSQAQDSDDSYFERVVNAPSEQDAISKALADEPANVYVSAVKVLPALHPRSREFREACNNALRSIGF